MVRKMGAPGEAWLRENLNKDFWHAIADARGHPLVVSELIRLWRSRCKRAQGAGAGGGGGEGEGGHSGPYEPASPASADRSGSASGAATPTRPPGAAEGPPIRLPAVGANLLGALLRLRLDSTSIDARLAVKTAAVIGENFTLSLLSRVCPELTADKLEAAKQVRRTGYRIYVWRKF